ncbi:nucleotidyltransferase domain-containing protein [Streptomyces sp. NBC_01537]|uniref:nucleotidyltransferase domain-containing protein n=1 Tax=Streptomyces sp. NBC_01537 TaxID=2903896 RepID=UPI0038678F51
MDDPIRAARTLVGELFPDALAAILGGSTAHGKGTPTSDLDIVVVLDGPAEIRAESLLWRSWPVEVFVQTYESALAFMKWDRGRGTATLAFMCGRGVILLDRDGSAARLRSTAERIIGEGRPAASGADLDRLRYTVTDLRDDLTGAPDGEETADELLAIAAALLNDTAALLFAALPHWGGGGKWLPRRLREADPELAEPLLAGYRTLVRGGPREPFAEAVGAVLDRCGGPLWAGFTRTLDARMRAELGLVD